MLKPSTLLKFTPTALHTCTNLIINSTMQITVYGLHPLVAAFCNYLASCLCDCQNYGAEIFFIKLIKYLYIIFYFSYNAVQIVSNILYTVVNKDYDRSCVPRTQAGSAPSRRPPLPPFLSGLLTGTNHKCPRMSRHQAASVSFTHI